MKTELWMDDAVTISLEATDLIEKRLKEYGIILNPPEDDEVYIPIFKVLENYSNGYYRKDI